jgi:hypothetical protein
MAELVLGNYQGADFGPMTHVDLTGESTIMVTDTDTQYDFPPILTSPGVYCFEAFVLITAAATADLLVMQMGNPEDDPTDPASYDTEFDSLETIDVTGQVYTTFFGPTAVVDTPTNTKATAVATCLPSSFMLRIEHDATPASNVTLRFRISHIPTNGS